MSDRSRQFSHSCNSRSFAELGAYLAKVVLSLLLLIDVHCNAVPVDGGLVEHSREMSEFVSALHRYLLTKFALCESGGSVDQRSQRASDALRDTKSQESRNNDCQATYAGQGE